MLVGRALDALAGQAPFLLERLNAAALAPAFNQRVAELCGTDRFEERRRLWAPVAAGLTTLAFALVEAGVSAAGSVL